MPLRTSRTRAGAAVVLGALRDGRRGRARPVAGAGTAPSPAGRHARGIRAVADRIGVPPDADTVRRARPHHRPHHRPTARAARAAGIAVMAPAVPGRHGPPRFPDGRERLLKEVTR
ncbi:hypothetical protein [Streptomyces sp. NPDC059906]|uniref:hypothetical protein n=1 Tax=Streptomyces sp. NPDC059906 TaxID=3346997 RepID=UPI00365FFB86